MIKRFLLFLIFITTFQWVSADSINYAIVSSKGTVADPEWVKVIDELSRKHEGSKVSISKVEKKKSRYLLNLEKFAKVHLFCGQASGSDKRMGFEDSPVNSKLR